MDIERTLVIATSYVTKDEHDDLNAGAIDWPIYPHEDGWRIWVPWPWLNKNETEINKNEMERKLSAGGETPCPSLIPLILYAHSQGCAWINLDRDADTDLPAEDFPTHEW